MFTGSLLLRFAEYVESSIGLPLQRIGKILLLVLLIAGTFVGLFYQFRSVMFRYELDYGEAVVLDEAMRLAEGQSIYRTKGDTPYTVTVYPPMYMVFLVPFVKLFGPGFAVGRIVSGLSAYVTAFFIGMLILRHNRDRFAAIAGSLVFLIIPYVVLWSTLLRIDMTALALSMAGLYVLSDSRLSRARFWLGVCLLALAVYTRQTYVFAAPLAIFVHLYSENRKMSALFALAFAGLILGVFVVLNLITGGGFYGNVIEANVLPFHIHSLKAKLNLFFSLTNVLALCSLTAIILIRGWNLVTAYLVGAFLSSLAIGRAGAHVNYLLEVCAAMSLTTGFLLSWVRKNGRFHLPQGLLTIVLAYHVCFLIWFTCTWYLFGRFQSKVSQEPQLVLLEQMIRDHPGPILIDDHAGMLSLQGRFLTAEPFILTQLQRAGKWDATPLIRDIQSQVFPLIVISKKGRWPDESLKAIERHYVQIDDLAGSRIYRPEGTNSRTP